MTSPGPVGLKIVGTGRAVAGAPVRSEELDRLYARPPGFFEAATGVRSRHFCTTETQIDLAVSAAQQALDEAGLRAKDLDLILSAAAVPYQPIPAMAPAIQQALVIPDGACFAMDVNATCLGFAAALQTADAHLRAGTYRRILIVSSELASRGLPWAAQPEVAGLFGDGAGAAVVTAAPGGSIVASRFTTLPSAYEACALRAGGTRFDLDREPEAFAANAKFAMDGPALFRLTAKHFGAFVEALLADADTRRQDIRRVIAHQASPGALAHMTRLCGFAPGQVVDISATYGNQIAASIPFVLDHARKSGLATEGDRILILGTSAGVSFGGLVLDL